MENSELLEINELYLKEETKYKANNKEELESLNIFKIIEGYKCCSKLINGNNCNALFEKEKTMKAHMKKEHKDMNYSKCFLQNINTKEFPKYIHVNKREEVEMEIIEENKKFNKKQIEEAIKKSISSNIGAKVHIESNNERNLFYQEMDWYKEDDLYKSVDKLKIMELPNQGTIPYVIVKEMKKIISKEIMELNEYPVNFRCEVGSTENNIFKKFSKLNTEKSISEYVGIYIRLIYFVLNLEWDDKIKINEGIKEKIKKLKSNINLINIFELVFEIIKEEDYLEKKRESIIVLFVRFNCYFGIGKLMKVDNIERVLSKMIYLYKLTMIVLSYKKEKPDIYELKERKTKYLTCNNANTFSTICLLKAKAKGIKNSNINIPTIIQGNNEFDVVQNGCHFSMKDLKEIYQKSFEEASKLMQKLLFEKQIYIEYSKIQDNLSNEEEGYKFMLNSNNTMDDYVLNQIMFDNELSDKYIVDIKGNEIIYNLVEIEKYLKIYDEYIKNLLILIHISSGMPARATEIETYKIKNGETGLRSVYYLNNQIFIHQIYSKNRAIGKLNTGIARFLNKECSELILKDLLVIRPFIKIVSNYLKKNKNNVYGNDLFVINGKKMNEENIKFAIESKIFEYSGKSKSFGAYRQIAQYFMNIISMKMSKENLYGELLEIVNKQIGHSNKTSNLNYGIHTGELSSSRDTEIQSYRYISNIWIQFIKEYDSNEKKEKRKYCKIEKEEKKKIKVEEDQYIWKEEGYITNEKSELSLKELKKLYKNEEAEFRSVEQKNAMNNVLFTNKDLMCILPTGCGKSLLIFLYVFMNRNKTNLVIVPTISLITDLVNRSTINGISCCRNISEFKGENLIVMTPEAFNNNVLVKNKLQELKNNSVLGKIYIDEVHLFSIDNDYRPDFRSLSVLGFVEVPMITLTATAPEWIVEDIKENIYGGRKLKVIRQNTNRENIRYKIIETSKELELFEEYSEKYFKKLSGKEKMIVYTSSIKSLEKISKELSKKGIENVTYFSKMDSKEKEENFEEFMNKEVKVMIATTAFGLGIDYGEIKYIILFGLSYSIEDYIQQTGRGGRNGLNAKSVMIFNEKEIKGRKENLEEEKMKGFEFLVEFSKNKKICRRSILTEYFDGKEMDCKSNEKNVLCDICSKYYGKKEVDEDILDILSSEIEEDKRLSINTSHAQVIISQKSNFGNRLLHYMKEFEENCIICFVRNGNRDEKHFEGRCTSLDGYCIKCFKKGHRSKECLVGKRVVTSVCYKCYLPDQIENVIFHRNGFGSNCFKDTLKLFSKSIVKFKGYKKEEDLFKYNNKVIMKLWEVFVEYCEKN